MRKNQSSVPTAGKVSLKLNWATHEAAKYACENWHYSKCIPKSKLVKIGVWENGQYTGCIIFGLGATPNLSKAYGLTMTECCELCRIALTKHQTPVSRILSIAVKFLKKKCPGLKLIVSFADSDQGHHGGIYQASNWIYSGSVRLDSWLIKGEKIHPRSVVTKYGSRSLATVLSYDRNAKKVWAIKHRYLMPLTDEISKRIVPLRKPYPKRAVSKDNVVSVNHTEEGGVNPTTALQKKAELVK